MSKQYIREIFDSLIRFFREREDECAEKMKHIDKSHCFLLYVLILQDAEGCFNKGKYPDTLTYLEALNKLLTEQISHLYQHKEEYLNAFQARHCFIFYRSELDIITQWVETKIKNGKEATNG